MATSVWMKARTIVLGRQAAPLALTMPAVTEQSGPKGNRWPAPTPHFQVIVAGGVRKG